MSTYDELLETFGLNGDTDVSQPLSSTFVEKEASAEISSNPVVQQINDYLDSFLQKTASYIPNTLLDEHIFTDKFIGLVKQATIMGYTEDEIVEVAIKTRAVEDVIRADKIEALCNAVDILDKEAAARKTGALAKLINWVKTKARGSRSSAATEEFLETLRSGMHLPAAQQTAYRDALRYTADELNKLNPGNYSAWQNFRAGLGMIFGGKDPYNAKRAELESRMLDLLGVAKANPQAFKGAIKDTLETRAHQLNSYQIKKEIQNLLKEPKKQKNKYTYTSGKQVLNQFKEGELDPDTIKWLQWRDSMAPYLFDPKYSTHRAAALGAGGIWGLDRLIHKNDDKKKGDGNKVVVV